MDPLGTQRRAFGDFLRTQRQLAKLSLRQLAEMTAVSNPYLSQLERGQHLPSLRIVSKLAAALDVPLDTLLAEAGLRESAVQASGVEEAIRLDGRLSRAQKDALIATYRSMLD